LVTLRRHAGAKGYFAPERFTGRVEKITAHELALNPDVFTGRSDELILSTLPIMLVYAANDFDTTPGKDISAELDRQHTSHLLKIYPPIGKTSEDGHSLLYLGIPEWEGDVFRVLDENVKR
jgi:hypothetical protein